MTWNALIQTYNIADVLTPAHARQHLLDMRDRRRRHDPVAKIEDEPAIPEVVEDRIDRAIQGITTSQQCERVKIALNSDTGLHPFANEFSISHPVNADRIDRNPIHIIAKHVARTTRKSDYARMRHLAP